MSIFIPATRKIEIAPYIVYRPVRSWHAGNLAGVGISGCVFKDTTRKQLCYPPLSVMHRLYWHTKRPKLTIAAFLSYPQALGDANEYFWEMYAEDTLAKLRSVGEERFFGENAETEMEARIIAVLSEVSVDFKALCDKVKHDCICRVRSVTIERETNQGYGCKKVSAGMVTPVTPTTER